MNAIASSEVVIGRMTRNSSPPMRPTASRVRHWCRKNLRNEHQQSVSGGVTQRVVDQLEPVHVYQHHAGMQRVPTAARQFRVEPFLHRARGCRAW